MDDGNDDGYVPQISQIQIDYNLMDSGTNGNSSVPGYNNMYANAEMHHHQQQFAPHHGYPPGIPGQMNPAMMPGQMMNPAMMPTAAQAVPQQPAAKPKRGGGRKKANQSAAESQTQPLPASYPSHQMNPQMMQMRQQSAAGNPYNYPVPSQAQQKWPADYMQQQQYRPNQQGYPGYPMHPSAQNYYAANQQRPPPQYWPGQQGYPAGAYPGQNPQQARYPTPQPNQQQYYMDPSMYNYPPHGSATGGYPQAASSNHSQQQGQQSSFQQAQTPSQPNPYQQPKATPSAMTPISQANHMPTPYGQQAPGSSQQPNSQWPPPYNGVPSNYYPQQPMNSVQNLQRELAELERQYQQCSYQQKTMEVSMRMEQIYKRTCTVKQQLMSMQQPQQSPQNANNKGYPNYPSNGQIMDSSTANSTISPMSSNSSLHHSQSTEKAPARTPTVSTQDPNSSVSVMQTTPNQVQVNITPESIPGGRTLISVYHQYPGSDVMTNSTNATASTTSNYAKDTVPPEPLPPSLSADQQQMYGRNQHQNNGQLPLSSAPSTSTINSTTTVESKSNSIANTTAPSADYSNFSSQQTTNSTQPDLSPIPPQPIPTTSYNSNSEVQRQFPTENASETTKLVDESSVSSINNAKEHAIERVGNPHVEDTKPVISTTLESNLLKSNEESTKDSLADKSTDQLENTNETESFENELEDLQPPAAPRMITTNFEEDEDEYESEVVENKEASKQSVDEIETQSTVPLQNTKVEMVENDAPPVKVAPELEKHEVPVVEVKLEAKSRPIKEKPIPTIVEPSTSANESMEVTEKQEDSIADNEEPLADSTMEIEMEEAATKAKSQPKKKPKSKPPAKSRKSTSGGQNQRKRKKPESEEEEDPISDNEEFVPEAPSKKRSKGKATAVAKIPVLEEPKLEDFVEKRRSERNRAERKTYSEKMDIDEDLLEEIQTIVEAPSLNDSPSQATQPEWIVEKILGVRIVTKMLPKEPEEKEIEEPKDETKQETVNPTDTEQPAENPETSNEAVEKANDEGKEVVENGEKKKNGDETDKKSTKEPEEVELEEVQVEEIYVKFKGKSYLHCEWKSVEELEEMDRRIGGKINRFKAKYGEAYLDDSEYFNEDYTVVDRVLDEHIDEETGEHSAFIKWRSLAYEDCTWEDIEIVPKLKLEEYHRRNDTIDSFKTKERARPQPEEWAKIPKDKQYKFENTLRDYQVEGVNWLLYCWFNRQNCILADEMGLGKTIQTITFLQGVYDKGIHGPFLIVVPLSTLHNWEREFETWTDMNAVVYHGGAASREVIQNYEIFYDRTDSKKKQIYKFDALLTTYEMVVSDCEFLRKINYRVCVIDEAHRLKNRNSKLLTGGLHSFKMEHRVLLTGTPLQNNIQELFSLLNFLEPEQFGNSDSFLEQFGQCQTEEQVQKLQEILKPMMLRRLKEDVEKTLQPKEETIIEVQLTNAQKKYYRAILERNFTHLIKGTSVPSLMNVMMQLRHVCNHPFLLRGAEEQIISEFKASHPEKSEEDLQMFSLIQASGKLVLIDKLLPKLRQDGHKVLIFSQMVRVLDILEEFLVQMNYTYERIDGNIRGDHRQAAIDRFSKPDSDRFVFLLCTRAGGLGINLTAADTVIIFDSDWNPQNDLQAQARCHRIGQTKMVKVYRLITANTYERDMFDKASLKLGLDKAVLQSMTPKDNQQQLSRKEVEELLRKGAYGSVMDDESEGNKFSEEDIDTILSRRTQTIRLEPGVKGSTFAKASFAASNNREDIDLQDPEFWSKWAKAMNVDVNIGDQSELIMSEPRTRRKRFEDNYKGLHEGENESDGSDDDGTEPGASKSRNRGGADFSKSRSGKKRKRDDDEDYINYVNNAPDELTFNKSEFFKVEKLLAAYGWGRWKIIKEHSDIALSEKDIEHISRTLLLHCIREFRGDEKSREFVWQLIVPKNAILGKGNKKGVLGGGLYHEGWAALPEYNPPAFAVDSSFQRHIHRHSNKLMQRMFHLFVLQAQILGSVDENTVQNKPHGEIPLDVPVIGDPPLSNWDADCDKSFLIGIYKHGMENFEAIRTDSKLCFIEKKIEEMPTTIELNTRFKRLILMLSRKLEMALAAATTVQNSNRLKRWPRDEEKEFMRLLRIYGVKDDHEGLNVINWKRFREISTNLQQKTDSELLEELYCVLAMCTKQQGGELSDIDRRRASLVDSIPSKQAERLMFRLHLMRKIHAIITTGIQNVRTSLKLCSNKTMPTGWQEIHDEQLMIVADMHGLDNMVSKVSQQPAFEKLKDSIDEPTLLRRIMEICTTLETGRWNGKGSIEMLEDDVLDESGTQTPVRSLGQKQANRSRKKNSTGTNPFASSASPANNTNQANSAAAAQAMMEAALLPLLTASATTGSSLQQQQQLQQFQALMTMYALSSMLPSGDASSAAANKQAMAALGLLGEDALNLTNPKKTATASTSLTSNANVKPSASTPVAGSATSKANDLTSQLNISELLALFNIPEDTNIPVVNIENNVKLTGDKAPKLKNLDQWLTAHPKYRVDTSVMGGPAPTQTSTTKESTTSAKPEKTEVGTSNGVFKANTLEAVETPKATTSATNATATSDAKKPSSDMDSIKIGVFYKSTGVALSQDKWPSITNLESWLIKNPSTQVQTVFAPFAKELLPKTMHDRIGGEPSGTQSSSASTSLQQAASSAAAANLTNAMNLEALQIQLYLQQKMMESLNPSAYQNPYSALLGAAGSTANAGLNSSISSSSTAGLDANSAALLALFGAQLPTTTLSSQTSTPATKNSNTSALNNANALSSAMNEAALTAEILANPSLALLLNSGTLTNNNSAASLNSSLSSLPFGMDFNTALQLNALAQCAASPNVNSSAVSASLLSGTPASSKKAAQPTSSSKGLSKLDGIVEKLASSSQNANNSS